MISDTNLPEQLRDLIRTMINSGVDGTEVLKVTSAILLDIKDGKIDDPEKLQEMIDKAFGEEGRFEITPEILFNENSKVAGVERVIQQINDKFCEIPPVVKTIIEAEGITAFNEAKKLTEMYLGIPEEVRTVMTNNGMEALSKYISVNLLASLNAVIPSASIIVFTTGGISPNLSVICFITVSIPAILVSFVIRISGVISNFPSSPNASSIIS